MCAVEAPGGTERGVGSTGDVNCKIAVDEETDTVGVCGGDSLAGKVQWRMAGGDNGPQIYGQLIEKRMCHDSSRSPPVVASGTSSCLCRAHRPSAKDVSSTRCDE